MQKLILHIGTQKTGTSSLQKFLTTNAEQLKENGYYYPTKHIGNRPAHHFFAEASVESAFQKNRRRSALSHLKELYNPLLCEIQEYPVSVISSETFWRCNPFLIRELFKDFDVQVVVYLRNEIDFLASSYAQSIHASQSTESIQKFVKNHEVNLGMSLDKWSSAFNGKMTPRIFSKSRLHNGDIVRDFLNQILELESGEFDFSDKDGNVSLTNRALAVKLYFNKNYEFQEQARNKVYSFFAEYSLNDNSGKMQLPLPLSKSLVRRFASLQKYWAPKYFQEDAVFEYKPSGAVKPIKISPQECESIIEELIQNCQNKILRKS